MALPLALEKRFAIAAVRRACTLTSTVFQSLVAGNETLTKDDKSPVTVGDFAAQALVNTMLANAFPNDPIVGEESAAELVSNDALRHRIVQLANEAIVADLHSDEETSWGIGKGKERSEQDILKAIDRGSYDGGRTGRMWTLDPIDGTKGFLRGGQYAVGLALIIDSIVELGVIGCPNLPHNLADESGPRGTIFVAVRGQGAEQFSLEGTGGKKILIPDIAPSDISFLESVEAAHAALGVNEKIASTLSLSRPPVRMDSMAKYACLARGDGGAYLRLPTGAGYIEKIWDHAPGSIIVTEAGGLITDSNGKSLDFGLGRTLGENHGFVAAGVNVHRRILEAVASVVKQ